MSKTVIWVLVGLLAAAGAVVAFMEFRPRESSIVSAAVVTTSSAKGSSDTTATAAPAASATPVTAGAAQPEQPVTAPASGSATLSTTPTVDELIQSAAAYEGKSIALKGTILTQCTAGCEIALDDGTGVLSVQLEGRGKDRLIPLGKVGKTIQVVGTFHSSPRPQLVIEEPDGWQFVKS
jgi:hypothetical protein